MKPALLVVSEDAAWVRHLAAAAGGLGLAVLAAPDARRLPRPSGGAGLAVVDRAAGAPAVSALRRALPGYVLAFAAERGGLAADAAAWALTHGFDGVLVKDGSLGGLTAQLRALWRRAAAAARERGLLSPRGDLRFDPGRGRISFLSRGRWLAGPALSPKEAGLLRLVLEHPGRVWERAELLEAVWGGRGGDVNFETLDKQVAALRRKLGVHGRALRTVRGRGYRWD